MRILSVVGARPNFVKAAPVMRSLTERGVTEQTLVHTGQHYDESMSDAFFRELGLPEPDMNLAVGSGTHAFQTAKIMERLEPVLQDMKPDLTLVYGDVNSTLAAALDCAKLNLLVGHVEAGLRSRDRTMPEEINRMLTDQIADLLFTPSADANDNLRREGIKEDRIHLVGNVMIDSLISLLPKARKPVIDRLQEEYILVTLHRPSNVDDPKILDSLLSVLSEISRRVQVLFPVHPRTRMRLSGSHSVQLNHSGLRLLEPLSYLEFLGLEQSAALVITDSGGVQEETTFLGVPCLTVRENTERPITCSLGTNALVGQDAELILTQVDRVLSGNLKKGARPPLWDGKAAHRIADIVVATLNRGDKRGLGNARR